MKIIFLDIDGVLNSQRTYVAYGVGHVGMIDQGLDPRFDPVAVRLLERLVERTGARIVLSSAWRIGVDLGALAASIEAHYAWRPPLIARTGSLASRRGDEVAAWLDAYGGYVSHYVIIDDSSDFRDSQMRHFVRVDGRVGLTGVAIEQAALILGVQAERGKIITPILA